MVRNSGSQPSRPDPDWQPWGPLRVAQESTPGPVGHEPGATIRGVPMVALTMPRRLRDVIANATNGTLRDDGLARRHEAWRGQLLRARWKRSTERAAETAARPTSRMRLVAFR